MNFVLTELVRSDVVELEPFCRMDQLLELNYLQWTPGHQEHQDQADTQLHVTVQFTVLYTRY